MEFFCKVLHAVLEAHHPLVLGYAYPVGSGPVLMVSIVLRFNLYEVEQSYVILFDNYITAG